MCGIQGHGGTTNVYCQIYGGNVTHPYAQGIVWSTWKGNYYSLKAVKMMISR